MFPITVYSTCVAPAPTFYDGLSMGFASPPVQDGCRQLQQIAEAGGAGLSALHAVQPLCTARA